MEEELNELKNGKLHKAVEEDVVKQLHEQIDRRKKDNTYGQSQDLDADMKEYERRAGAISAVIKKMEEEGRSDFSDLDKRVIERNRRIQEQIELKYGIDRDLIREKFSNLTISTTKEPAKGNNVITKVNETKNTVVTTNTTTTTTSPKTNTSTQSKKKQENAVTKNNSKWGPLTEAEIDDAISKGLYEYTPGDQGEFDQFLNEHGYNPNKLKEEYDKNNKNNSKWGPLTEEEIDDAISRGLYEYTPGDQGEFDQFLKEHGYDPNKLNQVSPTQGENKPKAPDLHKDGETSADQNKTSQTNSELPDWDREHAIVKVNDPEKTQKATIPQNNKLPIRTFWEIYNDTHKEHCGTFRRTIFQMAHAPVFGIQGKDKDGFQKFLHAGLDIVSLGAIPALKLVARGVNAIAGTDKIYQEEYSRIEALPREEFEILVSSADEVNLVQAALGRTPAKLPDDRFYLNSKLMKQAKVNDLYLDAVSAILKKRSAENVEILEKRVFNNQNRIKELEERQNNLSQAEQQELKKLKKDTPNLKAYINEVSEKPDAFREAAKLKTGSFKNIAGWIFAKNNPDNREMIAEMARESHELAEAYYRGDTDAIYECDHKMDQILLDQTRIRQIGSNKNNLIDRGNASLTSETRTVERNGKQVEEQFIHYGEFLDKGPQTKTRELITLGAAGATLVNTVHTLFVRKGIDVHNTDVQVTNTANQHIHYKGQHQYEDQVRFTDQETIDSSVNSYVDSRISGGHAIGEYSNLDESGMEAGGGWNAGLNTSGYKLRDDALHEATHNAIDGARAAGNNLDKIDVADQYFDPIASHANKVFSNTPSNQIFDYYGIQQALGGPATTGAFKKLISDIGDGTVSFSGVVDYSGTVSGMQAGLMDQVSCIPSILSSVSVGRLVIESAAKDAEERAIAEIQKKQESVARQANQQQNQQQQNQQQQGRSR